MTPRTTALDYWDARIRHCHHCSAQTFNNGMCDTCIEKEEKHHETTHPAA